MAVTLYSGFVPVCVQLLTGLKTVLQKGEEHATAQKWDPAVVLNLRFYPDMFPLERQVRQVCNHALGAARVAGVTLPSLPDQDNSYAEMHARIDKVIDCLKGLSPSQIDGKDDAKSEEQRLNSSHVEISYAVFCLKKKKKKASATLPTTTDTTANTTAQPAPR